MKNLFSIVKGWDLVIIFIIVILSFLPFTIFSYQQSGENRANTQVIAVISIDNEIVKEVKLTGHIGTEIFDITDAKGNTETIEVSDERIRIKSATCPDQVCVNTGFISKPGKTIICLPHRIIIEIKKIDGNTDEMIISS